MALVTEDGTAKSDAESYVSVTDADTYFSNRGNATWAALSTTQKEQCLRQGTDYMIENFRSKWKGYRYSGTQALDWPRTFVYLEPFVHGIVGTYPFLVSDTIVPVEVQAVCAELAVRVSVNPLSPDLTPEDMAKMTKVGPITVEYNIYAPDSPVYVALINKLKPYLLGDGAMTSIVRT